MRTVFDCFCGLGGLSLAAELAGLKLIGGFDADPNAVELYKNLFPGKLALQHDLLIERPKTVLRKAGIARGDVSILVGGPPCQPYSINNHQRGTDDERCGLIERYLEFVSLLRPEWLLLENVPGFAFIAGGLFLRSLFRSLQGRGYIVRHAVFDASLFGVPQRRRRLLILACRESRKVEGAVKQLADIRVKTVTVRDALGDLPSQPSSSALYCETAKTQFRQMMRKGAPIVLNAHVCSNLSERNLRRISHIPPGGNWRQIPRRLLPRGMKRAHLNDHTTRYGRLHKEKLAFTLLTKCDPHWGCFLHPVRDRVITVREAARLQSIPDRVCFGEGLTANYRLIGNAVPPLLGKGVLQILR
jgi:DNA (cytosine-5)-methyltransferase 1